MPVIARDGGNDVCLLLLLELEDVSASADSSAGENAAADGALATRKDRKIKCLESMIASSAK